jgi:hypothetical protein
MSAPLVPSPLDYIGLRRFLFYPPIRNAEPNEWLLGSGSWFEVQVVNSRTGNELWIPRQYIGAVSETDGPLLTVGLTKELEYRSGLLEPRIKRVIEMPAQALKDDSHRPHSGPAPVVGIRLENQEGSHINRAMATLMIGAIAVCLLAAAISILARF